MKDALVGLAREMLDLATRDDVAGVALVIVLDDGSMSMRSATRVDAPPVDGKTVEGEEAEQ